MLDKIIPSKKERQTDEYPEEFEPKGPAAKTTDPDIHEFLKNKEKRREEKDGKKNTPQENVPKKEAEIPGLVPEEVEKSEKVEEPISETTEGEYPGIVYTRSFNVPVTNNNIETAKKIITSNVKEQFTVAFQAGVYVNEKNLENIKKTLAYFVDNKFKVVIVSEQIQEIPDDK